MKKFALILLIFVIGPPVSALAQESVNTQLRDELLQMARIDQEIRERLQPLLIDPGARQAERESLIAEMNEINDENIRKLEEIIEEHGWPGSALVGEQASGAAWLILQHADTEQQRRYIPALRSAVSEGEASASNLAMMEDRILASEGKNQIYGTQVVSGPDGRPTLHPVEDPANIDARREAAGLPPIEEYLEHAESELGVAIDRGNIPE